MMGITNLFLHPRGSWKKRVNFLGKKWFLWATVLISLVGYTVPTQAQKNPGQRQITYDVWRNGKIIGSYVLAFNPQGKQLRVTVDWNIKINGIIFTLYRSEHHSEEIWEGKQLISLISASNDNGKRRQFSWRQNNKTAEIIFDDHTITTTLELFPTSLWQPDTIQQTVLLDTVKGRLRQVNIEYQGTESIVIEGHSLPTKHYLISGEMTRHVWYGMDQDIVQVSFPASDGSMIIIRKRLP
jgi:hypothetical protein